MHPLQFVTMDYLTIEKVMGYEKILVIIDHCTRLSQAYPAKNQQAVTTAKLVIDFIRRYGFPEKIHSDPNFVGKVMKNLYKLTGIKQTKTTPYNLMGNGSSSDEPICLCTRSQRKTSESPSDNETNDMNDRAGVVIDEPVAQEIERQSNSYKSAGSGLDGSDGHVGTHSPPLAQRRLARQRKLPAKYDGFIIGPLKQLSAILEKKFLGEVYTEHYSQLCV